MYFSPVIIRVMKSRRMRWTGHVALTREMTILYKILVGKSEEKRPFGRARRRWDDNKIKIDVQEMGRI
jgi:hypothetical protein